jgi:hypothetical protein
MKKPLLASRNSAGRGSDNGLLHMAAEQERVLGEAAVDRARVQGEMLAALFTLPSRIIAWCLPDRTRLALQAAPHRLGFSFRRVLRNRPERGR